MKVHVGSDHAGLEPSVIGLASVVLVLAGVVERGRDELVDHVRQRWRPIRDHLERVPVRGQ